MPTTYPAPRTPALRTAHRPKSPPVPLYGGLDPEQWARGGRAEQEDRQTRESWSGVKLRSAYLHRLALPDHVGPGDHATARAILERVEALLTESCWTKAERVRLRAMRGLWERRVEGRDVEFQLVGWTRKMGRAAERLRADRAEAKGMKKVLEALDGWSQGV